MTISSVRQSLPLTSSFETSRESNNLSFAKQLSATPSLLNEQPTPTNATEQAPESTTDAVYPSKTQKNPDDLLRSTFQKFVGQTMFSQMIASMRSTQQEPAYFHGGQTERIFQGQLDQVLSEEITKASASQISDPMFKLFQLRRS